jgi:hypothetical protein
MRMFGVTTRSMVDTYSPLSIPVAFVVASPLIACILICYHLSALLPRFRPANMISSSKMKTEIWPFHKLELDHPDHIPEYLPFYLDPIYLP